MTVKTGGAWAGSFVTLDSDGALAAASVGPAGVLYVDGASNAASVTITGSNPYKFAVTLPSLTAGQRVDMYITATVDSVATAGYVASEQADTSILSDGVVVNSGTVTTLTNLPAITTDWITAAGVKADAVTKIQNGLATPTNITAGTITTVTNAPTDMAKESTLTAIKGAGWTDETLVAIQAAIEAVVGGATAAQVWAYANRTLTQAAASVTAAVSGSDITGYSGDTLSFSLTDIGSLTGYSKVYFSMKRDLADADSASLYMVEKTAGLQYINGAAATTAANGTLTINDEATGDVTIVIKPAETIKVSPGVYDYDVKIVRTAGTVNTLTQGKFTQKYDITKAVT